MRTLAFIYYENRVFEHSKMAAASNLRGKNIRQKLMDQSLKFAKENNFKKIFLNSNSLMESALYINRKYGLKEIEVETIDPYERCEIKMPLIL